jgi:uncharacterized SAM-binding protein YcdF (DUF218 family)
MAISHYAMLMISPLSSALLLGFLSTLLHWRGYVRAATTSAVAALAWLWLWSTPAASLALRSHIESQHPDVPVASMQTADAIVVLGGSVRPPDSPARLVDLAGGADRVWHAARLYNAGKAPLILLSGGSDPAYSVMSEAQAMQVFLRDLGVPDSAMLLEQESRNTRQNAENSARLLHQRGFNRILLVTSALHMERARREFESRGLEVIPAVIDREAGEPPPMPWRYLPDADALSASARALKELVGQLVVRMGAASRRVGVG